MLTQNIVIEWTVPQGPARIERILWVNATLTHIITIHIRDIGALKNASSQPQLRLADEVITAISTGQAKILDRDPYAAPLVFSLTDKETARRDVLWDAIRAIVSRDDLAAFDPRQRAKMVAESAKRTGLSRPTIYFALRRFWQGGMTTNALILDFDRCGGRGKVKRTSDKKRGRPRVCHGQSAVVSGINIDLKLREVFRAAFEKFVLSEKRSVSSAYNRMLEVMVHRGYTLHNGLFVPVIPPEDERPSLEQFRYWTKLFEGKDRLRAAMRRKGRRRVMLEDRAVLGQSTCTLSGPGEVFQVDATLTDIHLVDETRKWNIGRPIFYIVIDAFSRLIVGFYVGLEYASWATASLALVNTVTKKIEYCASFGIPIDESQWPCHHLPKTLIADGGEFAGIQAGTLSRYLDVDLKIAPPYRADWKGIVERNFGLMNQEIHWLPGAVRGPYKRCERDPREGAALTLREFRQIVIWSIWEHNNFYRMPWYPLDEEMIEDGVLPFPVNIWNWGAVKRAGYLREYHPDAVRMALCPEAEAVVTREGIYFKKLYYTCEKAEEEQWYVAAGMKGRWRVPVAWDGNDTVDVIQLRLRRGRESVECRLLPKSERYKGKTWREVEELFTARAVLSKAAIPTEVQGNAIAHTAIEQIVSNAKQAAETARQGMSTSKCLGGQAQHRAEAMASDRSQWHRPSALPSVPAPLPTVETSVATDPSDQGYVAAISERSALRQQREEVWKHER